MLACQLYVSLNMSLIDIDTVWPIILRSPDGFNSVLFWFLWMGHTGHHLWECKDFVKQTLDVKRALFAGLESSDIQNAGMFNLRIRESLWVSGLVGMPDDAPLRPVFCVNISAWTRWSKTSDLAFRIIAWRASSCETIPLNTGKVGLRKVILLKQIQLIGSGRRQTRTLTGH